jgi:hypothetical protein
METAMHTTSTINPPISTSTFLKLATFLKEHGSDRDPVDVVEDAIEYWMDNAVLKPEILAPDEPDARGYSWKSLFLPAGTDVRIKYNGFYIYAKVEGDFLTYKGERLSPNQFAFKATGSARDAWRDLWIKRPTDSDYLLADSLRSDP